MYTNAQVSSDTAVVVLLLLYQQTPLGNHGTFKLAEEGKRQRDLMKAMPEENTEFRV